MSKRCCGNVGSPSITPPCCGGCSGMLLNSTSGTALISLRRTTHTASMKQTSRSRSRGIISIGQWTPRARPSTFCLARPVMPPPPSSFFRKALRATHTPSPRVITVEKNAAYPSACATLQQEGQLPTRCTLRQCKYFNNVVKQDHRFLKRRINPGLGFGSFHTARRTLQGYEAMHMIRKGQLGGARRETISGPKPHHCSDVRIGGIAYLQGDSLILRQFLQQNPCAHHRCFLVPRPGSHAGRLGRVLQASRHTDEDDRLQLRGAKACHPW